MLRRKEDAVREATFPPNIKALLQKDRFPELATELLVVELAIEMNFGEIDALKCFLFDVDDVLDEVLHVEEGSEVRVLPTHHQKLFCLDDHQLVLGN
jgi:hypothetical protein